MQLVKHGRVSSTNEKDIFEERYYKINKWLFCVLGQWPYLSFFKRCTRSATIFTLAFTLLVPQVIKLITSWGEIDIFVETLSPLVANLAFNVKLANCIFNTQKIKKLLEETQDNWRRIKYRPEVEILKKHGETGRRLTIMYFIMIDGATAAWISTPFLPVLMDYIFPSNESRLHLVLFQTDYRVDYEKYYYTILFHGSIACGAGIQMFICHDTFYMVMAQHVSAMFEILRYRLENIIQQDEEVDVVLKPDLQKDIFYQQLISCLKDHRRNIEFTRVMESSCEWCLFIVIGLNMLVVSCTGSRTVAEETELQDVIRFAFFAIAQVVHLFCNSLPGQWIIDSSVMVRDSAYTCKWHMMSLRSRRLIVMLLRRSVEPCTITAGKMYVMSLENFCAVMKTSMSYFTLLTSMQ